MFSLSATDLANELVVVLLITWKLDSCSHMNQFDYVLM